MNKISLFLIVLIFLSSCGIDQREQGSRDLSSLLSLKELFIDPEGLILDSLTPGQWLKAGETLPLRWGGRIHRNQEDQLFLQIHRAEKIHYNYEGAIIDLTEIQIPEDIPQGEYLLEYRLTRQSRILGEGLIPLVLYRGNYRLKDIELFPPLLNPGVTLSAHVQMKADTLAGDPWILWTMDDKTLQVKRFSQGGDWIHFQTPRRTGVYPLEADIYPENPENRTGPSPFLASTELYIFRGDHTSFHRIWGPAYEIFHLFDRSMDLEALHEGNVPLELDSRYMVEYAVRENLTGAEFQSRSSIQFNGFALPLSQGILSSHSQSFYLLLDRGGGDQRENIYTTGSPADGLSFTLMQLGDQLVLSLGEEQSYHRLSMDLTEDHLGQPMMVTYSLHVEGESREMSAFLNGEYQGSVQWRSQETAYLGEGETLFGSRGGAPGFQGVLYSWMMYRPPEEGFRIQDDLFHRMKEFRWGDRLILAEGFDASSLPEKFVLINGEVDISKSRITLLPGQRLQTSAFPLYPGMTELQIQGEYDSEPNIFLISDKRERLRLSLQDNRVIIQIRDGRLEQLNSQGEFESVRLISSNTSPLMAMEVVSMDGTLSLDSIFIHR